MDALPEAIARVAPASSAATNKINAARSTTLGVATPTQATMPIVVASPIQKVGGRWMTFIWLPTVTDEVVRLAWGDSTVSAVAADRAFIAGVEYDYWVPIEYTHWSGLSAGGGELSWHVSNR